MKEIKLTPVSIWNGIAMIITALIVSAAAVFIALEYNKTQWDIANIQKEAQLEASSNIKSGLGEIGSGVCKTSDKTMMFC